MSFVNNLLHIISFLDKKINNNLYNYYSYYNQLNFNSYYNLNNEYSYNNYNNYNNLYNYFCYMVNFHIDYIFLVWILFVEKKIDFCYFYLIKSKYLSLSYSLSSIQYSMFSKLLQL